MRLKKLFAFIFSMIIIITFVTRAYGAYTGPNRSYSYTVWRRRKCDFVATQPGQSSGCTLTLYVSPNSSCPSNPWQYFTATPQTCWHWTSSCTSTSCSISNIGNSLVSCSQGQDGCTSQTVSGTHPPATVSGSTSCSLPGGGGWCRGGATFSFSASEPVSGYNISHIEGNYGSGDQNLCNPANAPSITCSWSPPGEGVYNLNFWANSTYGDTSTMESRSISIDTSPPSLSHSLSGTSGSNGWYISPVTVTVSASDNLSGVASKTVQVNGGADQDSPVTVSDEGTNSIVVSASDAAGNSVQLAPLTLKIDLTDPTASILINPVGPDGNNSWYVTPPVVSASGQDDVSGVESEAIRQNDGAWSLDSITVEEEGIHLIEALVTAVSGRNAAAELAVKFDHTPPILSLTSHVEGDFISSSVSLTGKASDNLSGLDQVLIKTDGSEWEPVKVTGTTWSYDWDIDRIYDGEYHIQLWAADQAGNISETAMDLVVTRKLPTVALTDRWYIWEEGLLTVQPGSLPISKVRVTVSDSGDRWPSMSLPVSITQGEEKLSWSRLFGDGTVAPSGEYPVTAVVSDLLGRSVSASGVIVIPVPPTETQEPGEAPTEEIVPVFPRTTSTPESTVVSSVVETSNPVPPEVTVAAAPPELKPFPWLFLLGLVLSSLGLASVMYDPRPPAVRKMAGLFEAATETKRKVDKTLRMDWDK